MEGDQKTKHHEIIPTTDGSRNMGTVLHANMFQPHPSENSPEEEEALMHYLETPYQLDPPLSRLLRLEVHALVPCTSPTYPTTPSATKRHPGSSDPSYKNSLSKWEP
jgi:hypothetical protein